MTVVIDASNERDRWNSIEIVSLFDTINRLMQRKIIKDESVLPARNEPFRPQMAKMQPNNGSERTHTHKRARPLFAFDSIGLLVRRACFGIFVHFSHSPFVRRHSSLTRPFEIGSFTWRPPLLCAPLVQMHCSFSLSFCRPFSCNQQNARGHHFNGCSTAIRFSNSPCGHSRIRSTETKSKIMAAPTTTERIRIDIWTLFFRSYRRWNVFVPTSSNCREKFYNFRASRVTFRLIALRDHDAFLCANLFPSECKANWFFCFVNANIINMHGGSLNLNIFSLIFRVSPHQL